MIDHYDWRGGREAMLRFGPDDAPVVIAAAALLEEANRTRTFLVAILRNLATRGIASVLPDLPGTGDSLVMTADARLSDWREAYAAAAAAGGASFSFAIRGGSLLDGSIAERHHFSPVDGAKLVREMTRARAASSGTVDLAVPGPPVELLGNSLSRALIAELEAASPLEGARIVRLESDPAPANRKIAASPLWRRAEPGTDTTLSDALADDIATWISACAG